MASLCVVCSQQIQSTPGTITRGCFACVNATLALLSEIEIMATMLDTTPHRRTDNSGGPRRPFYGPRIPIDLGALATLDVRTVPSGEDNVRSLLGTIHGIADSIREQRGEPRTTSVLLCRELGYLRSRLAWCATREDFADVVADIRDLHRHVRLTVRTDRPQPVGRCPTIIDRIRRCGVPLEVWADDDEIRCPRCRSHWDRADYLELAQAVGRLDQAQAERKLIDRRALMALTGRSERVIRQHLTAVRYAEDGAALYDAVEAVRQLARITVRSRRDTPSAVVDAKP